MPETVYSTVHGNWGKRLRPYPCPSTWNWQFRRWRRPNLIRCCSPRESSYKLLLRGRRGFSIQRSPLGNWSVYWRRHLEKDFFYQGDESCQISTFFLVLNVCSVINFKICTAEFIWSNERNECKFRPKTKFSFKLILTHPGNKFSYLRTIQQRCSLFTLTTRILKRGKACKWNPNTGNYETKPSVCKVYPTSCRNLNFTFRPVLFSVEIFP